MTMYVFSCVQHLENEAGRTIDINCFTRVMTYDKPTKKSVAAIGFVQKHSESKYGKNGWKLTGAPTVLKIDPELVDVFKHCIDDGEEEGDIVAANQNTKFTVVD